MTSPISQSFFPSAAHCNASRSRAERIIGASGTFSCFERDRASYGVGRDECQHALRIRAHFGVPSTKPKIGRFAYRGLRSDRANPSFRLNSVASVQYAARDWIVRNKGPNSFHLNGSGDDFNRRMVAS